MPRKGRGGARTGTPGKSYANRSDLNTQPVRTAPSQQYGQGVQQEAAQKAIPLPDNTGLPAPTGPQAAPGSPGGAPPTGPLPGELGAFDRATELPSEPVTAGLPIGAGPGPEVLTASPATNATANRLRSLYQRYPSDGLLALIENLDED